MSCAACVRRVELGLTSLQGVTEASVNLAAQKATVEYDPQIVKPADLEAKISDLGYEPVSSPQPDDKPERRPSISVECIVPLAYGVWKTR